MPSPKRPNSDTKRSRVLALTYGVTAIAVGFLGPFIAQDIPRGRTEPPTNLVRVCAADRAFSCVVPEDWERRTRTEDGESSLRAAAGDAVLLMTAKNLSQDSVPGRPTNEPVQASIVERLHTADKARMEQHFAPYNEEPMKRISCPLGDARESEWTGETGWLSRRKIHGYRVTVVNQGIEISVSCRCSEPDWRDLQHTFQTVIASLSSRTS